MNKKTLKELFDLEQQLGVSEKDRFHNSENGKKMYEVMFSDTEKQMEREANIHIAELSAKVQDYRHLDIEIKHAKELYDKFHKQTYKYHTISGVKKTNNISKETAKTLALIVVNEVLNEPKMRFLGNAIGDGNGCMDVNYRHWVNVKSLIEKM